MKEKLKKEIEKQFKNKHRFFIALVEAGYRGSYQSVLNWIDGKHEPQFVNMRLICKVLNKEMKYFFNDEIQGEL